ncbi:MAG TPA: hypothetical protein VF819_01595 [Nitrospira sp.]
MKFLDPKDVAILNHLQRKDLRNEIESAIVGSSASIQAYEDEDYKSTELAFRPGQCKPNLGSLGIANDIESMKIICGKG